MNETSSYTGFVEDLLIACAVVVKRKTDRLIDVEIAAASIRKPFDQSWPDTAIKQLARDGLLRGSHTVGKLPRYSMTGRGLAHAEKLVKDRGQDLARLIQAHDERETKHDTFPTQPDSPVLSAEEGTASNVVKLGRLIRLSREARYLSEDVEGILQALRQNNALIAADYAELDRHIAHIDIGRSLLRAEKAYIEFLDMFLLASLRWFYPKIAQGDLRVKLERAIDFTRRLLDNEASL